MRPRSPGSSERTLFPRRDDVRRVPAADRSQSFKRASSERHFEKTGARRWGPETKGRRSAIKYRVRVFRHPLVPRLAHILIIGGPARGRVEHSKKSRGLKRERERERERIKMSTLGRGNVRLR